MSGPFSESLYSIHECELQVKSYLRYVNYIFSDIRTIQNGVIHLRFSIGYNLGYNSPEDNVSILKN